MLLTGYRKEISRPECNHSFQSLHCIAHLQEDIGEVIPFLNAVLGGDAFTPDPPSVTFKVHGKLVTVHARQIAVNALKDAEEAEKILQWLLREINQTWERRGQIEPSFQAAARPQVLSVLKLLPWTNCGRCGDQTCMLFAVRLVQGGGQPGDCPELDQERTEELEQYLGGFSWD